MASKKYIEYLQSDDWAQIRIEIINVRKCCERCGSKRKLRVHHKTYDNIFNEEPEDLELLCNTCHEKEHGIKKKQPKKKKKPIMHMSKKQLRKMDRKEKSKQRIKDRMRSARDYQRKMLKYGYNTSIE